MSDEAVMPVLKGVLTSVDVNVHWDYGTTSGIKLLARTNIKSSIGKVILRKGSLWPLGIKFLGNLAPNQQG